MKNPIVGVAEINRVVIVFHVVEKQLWVKMRGNQGIELALVERHLVIGNRQTQLKGAARTALACTLGKSGGIGETAVVENIIYVEAAGHDIQTVEIVAYPFWTGKIFTEQVVKVLATEVVACLAPIKVNSHLRCVETQVELHLFGSAVFVAQQTAHVESVT